MKHLVIFFLVLIISQTSFGQDINQPKPVLTKSDYLHKSKSQKVAGFVLLGVGVGAVAAVSSGDATFNATEVAVIAAGACVATSIVLFIASGRNKRKAAAMAVNFKWERFPELQTRTISYSPALKMTFRF